MKAVGLFLALSCFCPLQDCPLDGTQGIWVPGSQAGLPDPWVEAPFPCLAGESLVLESRTIHCGGGRSPAMPSTERWRVVAFATLVDRPRDYGGNAVAFRPPWAVQRQSGGAAAPFVCSAKDCTEAASHAADAGCAACGGRLCAHHAEAGTLCSDCEDGAHPGEGTRSISTAQGARRTLPGHALLALWPSPGTDLITVHSGRGREQARSGAAEEAECPLEGTMHFAAEALPAPRSRTHCAAVTPPGTLLVIAAGDVRGLAVRHVVQKKAGAPAEEAEDQPLCHWWQWEMIPSSASFMDPAVAQRGGFLVEDTVGWACPCKRQVCSAGHRVRMSQGWGPGWCSNLAII